ncbi:MAG: hypothetical protein R3F29_00025 [Planctomycetota bacterium]
MPRSILRHPFSAVVTVVMATPALAQTVHVVGPTGSYATIQQAVDAASVGDRVHVQPGTYAGFQCNKGLVIRALGAVGITDNILLGSNVTLAPPSGQTVDVVGISLQTLNVNSGRVTLDHSSVQRGCAAHDASLHLVSCVVVGPGGALVADNCAVTATDTTFGSSAPFAVTPTFVELSGSRFHASGCTISGGFAQIPTHLLDAWQGSRVWLADCWIGGVSNGDCPIRTDATSTVRGDRTTVAPGVGVTCTTPTPGLLLGVQSTTPLQLGQNYDLHFSTAANGFVVVFAGPFLGETDFGPLLEQPSWLDDQHSFALTLLLADGNGDADVSIAIPANPAFADLSLWFKGISGLSLPLQASPPIGGIAR